MNNKTYTITCHNVFNCGASLQAFALQQYIKSLGIDNKIIDYNPAYLSWHYRLSWWIPSKSSHYNLLKRNPLLRVFYVIIRYFMELKTIRRKKRFEEFNKELDLTVRFYNLEQLSIILSKGDVFIVGSDQVWNSDTLENGMDPVFYLDFVTEGKRISYAASFGTQKLGIDIDVLNNYLNRFAGISLRENSAQLLIQPLGLKASVVCDPVFLISRSQWQSLGKRSVLDSECMNEFLLVYNLGKKDEKLVKDVHWLSNKNGINIVNIVNSDAGKLRGAKNYLNIGPYDFLSLLSKASMVFTNSFHAVAFSLIFNKDFFVYSNTVSGSVGRITDLLDSISLKGRIVDDNNPIHKIQPIEYSKYNQSLNDYIGYSKDWLNAYLKG